MLTPKIAAAALALTAVASFAAPARANCAMPLSYNAAVVGNTVTVTPTSGDSCPQPGGMLRQNPTSGEIVKLADFCGEANSEGIKPYVDECVPAGTYRYGFATPYTCSSAACGTDYFVQTTVSAALDPACARSAGDSPPTAESAVPWEDDPTICDYGGSSGGCSVGLPSGAAPVLGANVVALLAGLALMRRRAQRA